MGYAETVSILQCTYSVLAEGEIYDIVDRMIADGNRHQICISNVHTTMMAVENPQFSKILNSSSLVTMDGRPLVWAAKNMGKKKATRVAGPDFFQHICSISPEKGYTHFLYGGREGVPERMQKILESLYPGIRIVGVYSPPFRPLTREEDEAVIKKINAAKPNFVWIGLGAPKQEQWAHEHLEKIHANIFIGIGAAFDFIAGTIKRAPKWMQDSGLEWLFRLSQDPARLWKRYLVYNTKYLIKIIPDIIRYRISNSAN